MRSPCSLTTRLGAFGAAGLLAAMLSVTAVPAGAATTNAACKLLSQKSIKKTLGLSLPKGKPADVIDDDQETAACVWADGVASPQRIAAGLPGVYLTLVNPGDDPLADLFADTSDDDSGESGEALVKTGIDGTGAEDVFAATVPGGNGTVMGFVFGDSSGAVVFIGSTPSVEQLRAFGKAIATKHG